MKRYISNALAVLFGCSLFWACADNDYTELDKGNTELSITASSADVVLNEVDHSSDAMELTWTTGTNYNTGNRITYTVELAEKGTNFANPYVAVDGETQVYSWKKNTEELNTILRNTYGVKDDGRYSLEARVTANVLGMEATQTAMTTFDVTTYTPVTGTLYITGTATGGGDDLTAAEAMTKSDNGVFSWQGKLGVGSFKFIATLGQELPSYNNNGKDSLVLRSSADQPDSQFEVTEEHYYKIDVNLLTGVLKIEQVEGIQPPYDQLFLVGEMTDWGFEPMTQDALDPFLFRYGQVFEKGGEFKFGTASGSWENMYKATEDNASYKNTSVEFVKGYDPDHKWKLTDAEVGKAYKICVDIRPDKERMMMKVFEPYEMIYLIGSAAPNGWSMDEATPMTADATSPYTFTWTGTLNAGELKFTCDKQSDWNGAWFMPVANGIEPTGKTERMLFIDKSDDELKNQYPDNNIGDVDYKWNIKEAGSYSISLNQLTEEIIIKKK